MADRITHIQPTAEVGSGYLPQTQGSTTIEHTSPGVRPLTVDGNDLAIDGIVVQNCGQGGIVITQPSLSTSHAMTISQPANQIGLLLQKTGTGIGDALHIDNDGSGRGIYIDNDGTAQAIQVENDGDAVAVTINQNYTAGSRNAMAISQAGNAIGLYCAKNGTSTGHCAQFVNAGTGYGVLVQQTGVANALRVVQSAATDGAFIYKSNTGAGAALVINDQGTGSAIYVDNYGGGYAAQLVQRTSVPGVILSAADESYAASLFQASCWRSANSAYAFYTGYSDTNGTSDLEVRLRGDGAIQSDIAATTPADYAEYFEALDPAGFGAGLAVQMCEDQANASKVELATDATKVVGFVSAAPAVIGDSAWSRWTGKYLKDKFGAYQLDENGDRVLNPEFDPELEYEPRADRPEWQTIGMLGKLWVRSQDTDILPGQRVTLGDDGLVRRALDGDTVSWHVSEVRDYDVTDGYQVVRIIYK